MGGAACDGEDCLGREELLLGGWLGAGRAGIKGVKRQQYYFGTSRSKYLRFIYSIYSHKVTLWSQISGAVRFDSLLPMFSRSCPEPTRTFLPAPIITAALPAICLVIPINTKTQTLEPT
jgi:hypothetical protein